VVVSAASLAAQARFSPAQNRVNPGNGAGPVRQWNSSKGGSSGLVSRRCLLPRKKVEERFQLTVSPAGVPSLELHLAFALRRTVELETLILEGKTEYMPQTVADFERQVMQAANLLARLSPEEKSQSDLLVMELERSLANQGNALKVLVQMTPTENQPELLKTIRAAEDGLLAWHVLPLKAAPSSYRN
jgi:hypothetical protein